MAYAALVSLAQTIDLALNHDKYSTSVDEKEKIISIHEYVIFLLSFLEDFPEKANSLEGQIRDVANQTEDIIEYFMWKQIQSRYQWMRWSAVGLSRVKFEHQLKKVTQEIGSIAGEVMDIKKSFRIKDDRLSGSPAAISSSRLEPTGKNDKVIGVHDDDLMAIKGRLCGESSKLEVIPIFGMGGIGKTTLTKNAYDDPLIMERFEIRAWVTVSQDYSAQEVFSGLLASMKLLNEQMFGQKNELIAEKLYKSLKGRRYLIVMDDVWSTNAWDDVRNILPDDGNGSRIMLTTRLSNVAAYADSCSRLHEMRFIDENQSWNLLKHKVFTNGQDCPPELEDVGKEIARRCRGLPLAVVLVAGILSTVIKGRASWEEIAKNMTSVVDGQLERILSLSYKHLPHHLRPCFLFFGVFPEDYEIHVSKLIKLWVAESFLKRQNGYKISLEEKAEEYLEDLVKRSLVLVTSRKTNGKIKSCGLHDLVRDLCIRKAQDEKFLLHILDRHNVLPKSIINQRRISIPHSHLNNISGPTIHTIVSFQLQDCATSLAFLRSYRLLRVLDVVNDSFRPLPSQVFDLFHLRFLALGNFIDIPSAISNLENLETLIIQPRIRFPGCRSRYSCLPLEIWRMPKLRHLVFSYSYRLPDPTYGYGSTLPLENLQTLSPVVNLVCSEKMLKMIPNLKKLGIIFVDYRSCISTFYKRGLHNLIYLHQLEKLKLDICMSHFWQGQNPAFPNTLKKLTLLGGRLSWEDMGIVGSLPNLEVLKLRKFACSGDTWETIDGEFLQLKHLLIEESHLQHWITESSHFPRLKCLVLYDCLHLREIPDGIGEIPTLERIEMDDRNKSLLNSAKQIQEDQESCGNEALQVRCIHYDQDEENMMESVVGVSQLSSQDDFSINPILDTNLAKYRYSYI